jgi:hypothetical protein
MVMAEHVVNKVRTDTIVVDASGAAIWSSPPAQTA